jgi:hypothetical protein
MMSTAVNFFLASDSGSLWKCTNQSQSLPHFVAQKKFPGQQKHKNTSLKRMISLTVPLKSRKKEKKNL